MNRPDDPFQDLILAKARAKADEASPRLSVAVLGPGLNAPEDLGGQKRRQIREALENDGHRPFFPEDCVDLDPVSSLFVEQERELLADASVDLVIILHTSSSKGVLVEIGNFVSVPEINGKTAVLFPSVYYTPDESLAANTARGYPVRMPYSDNHFESCQLVSECRKLTQDRAMGRWPGWIPHSF